MRIRATILLILAIVAAGYGFGLIAMRDVERDKFAQLEREREATWRRSVGDFLDRQGASLARMAGHFSALDGVVPAILDGDTAWARRVWDEAALKSFGAQALWAFRRDGSIFFTRQLMKPDEPLPLAASDIQSLLRENRRCHFHFKLPQAQGARPRFVEVRGERIHPTWDTAGTAPAEGYFFAGRLLDEEAVAEMALLSGDDRVALHDGAGAPPPVESAPGTLVLARPLEDWRGQAIGQLIVSNRSVAIQSLEARSESSFRLLLSASLALLALLYLVLGYAILRPLGMIVRGLNQRDMAALAPLENRRSEFGDLSRLIRRFFDQSEQLLTETRERASTQVVLRRTEEMLQHSQKMEAIGRLAGGVAHDFNNLLTAIIGYGELLARRLADDPAGRQQALLIHQAGEQAASLTRQLLAFSRRQLLQPRVIDINAIVLGLHKLLQRIIGEHIEIETMAGATQPRVRADAGQIEQVIVNLGVNARDAMPRGGKLILRTLNLRVGHEGAAAQIAPGDYVAIEVTDTGEGMDDETRSRIFEPFFTTKGPGKGTGLGLATVYGIVRQSNGAIVVESEVGRGSTFRVLLPEDSAPLDPTEAPARLALPAARSERILFVEDDELVRKLMSDVLRSHGYELFSTSSGAEAIRLAGEHRSNLSLLISDVVMPEINGVEVARRVREVVPGLKVLFVSGYSEADISDQGLGMHPFDVLQKPFSPDRLAQKVRDILDGNRSA